MDANSRLVWLPRVKIWRQEDVTDEGVIRDYVELSCKGIAMRYKKDELLAALRQVVAELEAA